MSLREPAAVHGPPRFAITQAQRLKLHNPRPPQGARLTNYGCIGCSAVSPAATRQRRTRPPPPYPFPRWQDSHGLSVGMRSPLPV